MGTQKRKRKKKTQVKIRKPIAPPSRRHKSKKDYNRKRDKKIEDE